MAPRRSRAREACLRWPSGTGPIARVQDAVQDSAAAHTVADVPVAVFLSGGIDSSAIVSAAVSAGVTGLRTCTVRFEGPGSEHEYAKLVASAFGTVHQEIVV